MQVVAEEVVVVQVGQQRTRRGTARATILTAQQVTPDVSNFL
jgi:hypothetical protein